MRSPNSLSVGATLLMVALLIGSTAGATTYHVETSGSDLTGNGSSGNPFKTIGKGVLTAQSGDTVLVGNGIYSGDGNRNISFSGKNLVVRSSSGYPQSATIDCGGAPNRAFKLTHGESAQSEIRGFTMKNGDVSDRLENFLPDKNGGLILLDGASTKIKDCRFTNGVAQSGGAIMMKYSSSRIEGCTFDSNYTEGNPRGSGGAICAGGGGNPDIDNCRFTYNSGAHGGAVYTGKGTIGGSIFRGNTADGNGGALMLSGGDTVLVAASTIYGNDASYGSGASLTDSVKVDIRLTVFAWNQQEGLRVNSPYVEVELICNDFWQNTFGDFAGLIDSTAADENTIFQDPLFCNYTTFTLSSYSPCLYGNSPCVFPIGYPYSNPSCDRCCNLPGDANNDGTGPDLSDLTYLVNNLMLGGPPPPCFDEGDVDGVAGVDLSDTIYLVNHLFYGGPAPTCP